MAAHTLPGREVSSPPATSARAAFFLCVFILLSATLFQKLALPGTGNLPINLLILPTATLAAFAFGVLEINAKAFGAYALFLLSAIASTSLASSARSSSLSLALVIVAQMPLIFRFVPSSFSYERLLRFLSMLGCFFASVGVLQFAAQFAVGSRIAFFLDTSLPESLLMKGFNTMIPLYWSSPVFKSNGFFFLEPSFFCQFLAVAVVAELLTGARVIRLVILGAGLLSSYSGPGLTMLALYVPFYILRRGRTDIVLVGAAACLVLIVFGNAISIDALTGRLDEFFDDQSSGSARFLSIFRGLEDVILAGDFTFVLGRGPGTVQEYFARLPYLAFDPTWGKVVYEYGLLGAALYAAFFYLAFVKGAKGLRFALGYTYLFLGGYLVDATVLMQVVALVVWVGGTTTPDDDHLIPKTVS
jgi:hypothetical protein